MKMTDGSNETLKVMFCLLLVSVILVIYGNVITSL